MSLSSISDGNLGDPNKQACFFDLADDSKMQGSNSVFSFSLVLILSSDLLHDFYSNSGIDPVPAMVEADTTRRSRTRLDRVVPVSTESYRSRPSRTGLDRVVPVSTESYRSRSSRTGLDRVVPVSTEILNPGWHCLHDHWSQILAKVP